MIEYLKSHKRRNALLVELRKLDPTLFNKAALNMLILAVKSYPEQQVYVMYDDNGNPLAAVAYLPFRDYIHVSYLGSIAPARYRAGSTLMSHLEKRGLPITLLAESDAVGFYKKRGYRDTSPPTEPVVKMTNAKEKRNVWNATYPA